MYSLLYFFKNACQILLKRLEPIIKKKPEGTWEDWVSVPLHLLLQMEKTIQTSAERAVHSHPT
jgi:hypothetical protein